MYKIIMTYKNCAKEILDEFTTKYEAEKMLKHYRVQYGSNYTLWIN